MQKLDVCSVKINSSSLSEQNRKANLSVVIYKMVRRWPVEGDEWPIEGGGWACVWKSYWEPPVSPHQVIVSNLCTGLELQGAVSQRPLVSWISTGLLRLGTSPREDSDQIWKAWRSGRVQKSVMCKLDRTTGLIKWSCTTRKTIPSQREKKVLVFNLIVHLKKQFSIF